MGYMGKSFNHPADLEDRYFTPMNPVLAGRSIPDMYGVVIHANIASMILNENYINTMPKWLNILLSFIVCYFFILFIEWFMKKNTMLYHLLIPVILLFITTLLVYLFFIMYKFCNYNIDSTFFLVPILLYTTFMTYYKRIILLIDRKINIKQRLLPD
jgi:CHASE2 domain-containing sensor protein